MCPIGCAPGWAFHPDGKHLAAINVPAEDGPRLVERGWVTVNGRRATVQEQYEGVNIMDGSVVLRIYFDEPYPRYGEAA